ncbi:MBL fold metallo-hydrolase [Paenibacillus sp. MER TA 81-3]|uniref:MBL fold metallo-hydrolase n=1 Tax=Paenibacillus sp. MER TA 81-3 TaxID=2939573 RepID=UPI00203FC584|nr:MBL fold metallo-hydrolase [Paenibacillus sp. MER TA 81-3]MCM3339325.1 MBL fold metallo-hydrolase [Paenibacillus sp. MER TA 81-3]
MQIRQIRNATIVLNYGGITFLIDPFLARQGTYPPFPNTPNQEQWNPTVELPIPVDDIVQADAVIVTHLHPDHFDAAAIEALPKDMRMIAQSEKDAKVIEEAGFHNVEWLDSISEIGEIRLHRTSGKHGLGEIGNLMGEVSGVAFSHADEPTLYIAGDTIWCDDVHAAIDAHRPEVIVVNAGAAQFLEGDPITMTKEDVYRTHMEAPQATIIVSHMESVNHCLLTREELKSYIADKGLSSNILVPADGESLSFRSSR